MTKPNVTKVPHKHAECIKAWADGATIEGRDPSPGGHGWEAYTGYPGWLPEKEYRVKPALPEKVYPVTGMSGAELHQIYMDADSNGGDKDMIALANAALRHAIDSNQVVTIGDHMQALLRLGNYAFCTQYSTPKFNLGDMVHKTKGAKWTGRVVGHYSTSLTPEGYAVESSTEHGSVQIYPASALEAVINK